jgi:hypothetical protein
LGFAATSRYLGRGLVLQGEVVLLRSRRTSVKTDLTTDLEAARAWALDHVSRLAPASVAMLAIGWSRPDTRGGAKFLADATRDATSAFGLVPAEVDRFEIASLLDLGTPTTVAIRLAMARRHAVVAAHVSTRRVRSEADRYWEPAVLAAAAALVLSRDPAHATSVPGA